MKNIAPLHCIPGMVFAAVLLAAPVRADDQTGYVAHEWGTFTSVQGSDGALLNWCPLETSILPKFVYDWPRAGFDRVNIGLGSKGAMTSLQRMETPVIYFYADRE